jgi:segregation and condensation protein B
VRQAAARLQAAAALRGVHVAWAGERLQMVSAAEACEAIERFLGVSETARLSEAALETLSIIAYRQPVTKAQVDSIRGVNCDGVVRSLLAKSLIAVVGRLNQAGRPMLYGTTMEFLQYFGIHSLDELPNLPDLPDLDAISAEAGEAAQAESPANA